MSILAFEDYVNNIITPSNRSIDLTELRDTSYGFEMYLTTTYDVKNFKQLKQLCNVLEILQQYDKTLSKVRNIDEKLIKCYIYNYTEQLSDFEMYFKEYVRVKPFIGKEILVEYDYMNSIVCNLKIIRRALRILFETNEF